MDSQTEIGQEQTRQQTTTLAAEVAAAEVDRESELWTEFAGAATVESFCRSWLALQCRTLGGVEAGLVLVGPADRGPFRPLAAWPHSRRHPKHLTKTAERTLSERRGLLVRSETEGVAASGSDRWEIGYPIEARGALHGAVVLEVGPRPEPRLKATMRQLHWGAVWLELLFTREALAGEAATRDRLKTALDLVASLVGHERFYGAAVAFATALATTLQCDRVSLGFLRRGRMRIAAMSHSAEFKQQANLVRSIAEAMEEAVDQREAIVYPLGEAMPAAVIRAHGELAKQHGAGALCTIPLEACGRAIGAVLLERSAERPFDASSVDVCRAVGALAGPVLEIHRREDRWLLTKIADSIVRHVQALVGPQHVGFKLGTAAVLGVAAFCLLATGDYRVSAKTVLEPIVQRAAAAPFNGYIKEAPVRAGDLVRANQVLCTLDDRELRLERLKSLSKLEEYQKEYHKAMAEREAAKVEILTAQINQVQSEIALLDDQLAHTRVQSPFDGIVVSGDLTQSLGAPVEKGKVLFEVAPLEDYRVVLEVDERDIADVAVGQPGSLLLSAFPSEELPVHIDRVTPVSTARESRNFFRVEARLDQPHERLRPGMEGAGKITIDRRLYVWIWTHRVVDWIRLTVWSWLP
jgi:RND family efflux transporter MFP subunit